MCNKEKYIEKYRKLACNLELEKKRLFAKIKEKDFDIVEDYIDCQANMCVILSCPGEEEMIKQKPAAGQTGINLLEILKAISRFRGNELEDLKINESRDQYQVSIINAYDHVFFRLVNDSEPNEDIVKDENNIKRIQSIISQIKEKTKLKYIIVCGNNAGIVFDRVKNLLLGVHYALVPHIGNVGIRNTYTNAYKYDGAHTIGELKQKERDAKRFEIIARDIISQLKNNQVILG